MRPCAFFKAVFFLAPALGALLSGCRTRSVAVAPPAADPPAEALALYGRALLHEFQNEPAAALELLAAALAADPDDERLNVRTAHLLMRQRRVDEAIAVMRRWVERKPDDPLRLRWLARAQIAAERLLDAEAALRQAAAADPAAADTVAEQIALHLRRDAGPAAVETLAAAARARPILPLLRALQDILTWADARENPAVKARAAALLAPLGERAENEVETLLALGNLHRRLNRTAEAGAAYERAAAAAPSDERAAVLAALMMAAQERESEALAFAEKAVDRVRRPGDLLRLIADLRVRAAARAENPEQAREHREAAIAALRRVLLGRPDDAALRLALGELLLLTDRLEDALREFRRVETAEPDIQRRIAMRFAAAGDLPAAVERLKKIAEAEPANSQIHYYLAELYLRQDDRENAIRSLRAVLAGDRPDPIAFIRLADVLAPDDPDAALEALRDGERKHPDDPRLAEARGQLHLIRRESAAAVEAFEAAERRRSARAGFEASPVFWVRFAQALHRDGRIADAVDRLERALRLEPLAIELYIRFAADEDEGAEDRERARAVLRELDRRRGDVLIPLHLGLFEHFVKNPAAAIAAFETAAERAAENPDTAEMLQAPFFFWFGAALERDGQMERAADMLLKSLELDPENAEAHNYLAYSWADRGLHLDRALEHVRRALEKAPENAAYIDTLGWIYFRQGRLEEALVELRRALEIAPEEYEIQDHVGDALFALGLAAEAVTHWSRAFVLKPDEAAIAEKLERQGVDLAPLRQEAEERKAQRERQRRRRALAAGGGDETPAPPPLPGLDLDREQLEKMDTPGDVE